MSLTYNSQSASHINVTTPSINSTSTSNVTESVGFAPFMQGSVQWVFGSITGTQPAYKLQSSNDGTNWDDVSGAAYTTLAASGSHTVHFSGIAGTLLRTAISTASTTGTLVTTYNINGRNA